MFATISAFQRFSFFLQKSFAEVFLLRQFLPVVEGVLQRLARGPDEYAGGQEL